MGFPAGASAYHTKENWQNANWVLWSTGELRVDSASFALIFSPTGCGKLAAKPLGCLTGAAAVAGVEPSAPSAFVASTSDPVHGLVRLTFQSRGDEDAFGALAQAAELAGSGRYESIAGRRSTMCPSRAPSMGGGPRDGGAAEMIACYVSERHPGSWPVVFTGAELYGPDPRGDQGSEVLLGRGAMVLLDSQDMSRVGSYDLLFYEESSAEASLRVPIGPRTKLTRQPLDVPSSAGRLSVAARRLSFGGGDGRGPGAGAGSVFELSVPGGPGFVIAFDAEPDAAGFERDFCVRHRLVTLSLKTSRGSRAVGQLEDQLMDIRQRGVVATLQWLIVMLIKMLILATVLYGAMLYYNDPERPLLETAGAAVQDVADMASVVGVKAAEASALACGLLTRSVSVTSLEQCVALPDSAEVRSCASALLAVA